MEHSLEWKTPRKRAVNLMRWSMHTLPLLTEIVPSATVQKPLYQPKDVRGEHIIPCASIFTKGDAVLL